MIPDQDGQSVGFQSVVEALRRIFGLLKYGKEFAGLSFKKEMLEKMGIPDIEYPVPFDILQDVVKTGNLTLPDMLFWLMGRAANSPEQWCADEEAILTISDIIAPEDERVEVDANGDEWSLTIGEVDLSKEVVTIQRVNHLVAAVQPRSNGSLLVSVYRALDLGTASYLYTLATNPPDGDTHWEHAILVSSDAANLNHGGYGLPYFSHWKNGFGITSDGVLDPDSYPQRNQRPLLPRIVGTQIGICYTMSDL